jgi:MFS family permease
MTLAAFGIYAATLNLIPLLTSQGTGSTLAATALAVCGAGQLIGRLGYPTLTHLTSPRMRAISIFTTAAITIALLGVVPSEVPALIAAAAAVGAARGAFTLLQATAISDRWGIRNFATLNGILVAPTTVAAALAPAGGALLAQWLSGYSAAFLAFAILALMGAFIGIASIPSQRRSVRAIPEHLSTTRHGLPQVQANAMQEGGSS